MKLAWILFFAGHALLFGYLFTASGLFSAILKLFQKKKPPESPDFSTLATVELMKRFLERAGWDEFQIQRHRLGGYPVENWPLYRVDGSKNVQTARGILQALTVTLEDLIEKEPDLQALEERHQKVLG